MNSRKQTVFITGVQGLIGWNLYTYLQPYYRVVGFSKTHRSPKGEWYEGLMEDYKCISSILNKENPDWVIHSQAMCNLDLCEMKPEKTHLINVDATKKLLEAMKSVSAKLVYISSDHVFSGRKGEYSEDDPVDPITVYGKTRVEAESYVLKNKPGALLIRPGLAIGPSLQGDIGPHDWLKMRLAKNLPASYFVDEYRSPIRTEELSAKIHKLMILEAKGIFHIGGERKISRYDLAVSLAKDFGMTGQILRKNIEDDLDVPRIADCSLDSSKIEQYFHEYSENMR